jgi:hypothetical protein
VAREPQARRTNVNRNDEPWWIALCKVYDQDPDDPDAFYFFAPDELAALIAQAKAPSLMAEYHARGVVEGEAAAREWLAAQLAASS